MTRKKILTAAVIVFLLFAGFAALTLTAKLPAQESGHLTPGRGSNNNADDIADDAANVQETDETAGELTEEIPEWVKPARWYRSNIGGMALEEIPSMYAALRNEYALVADFTGHEELPEYLRQYYDRRFFVETRRLYKNGNETRVQWIFRDSKGTARLIAVIAEPEKEIKEDDKNVTGENIAVTDAAAQSEENPANAKTKALSGFIEIFDDKGLYTLELNFFDNGDKNKIEYEYNSGILIKSAVFTGEGKEDFTQVYSDFFRYNRSSYLRSVERVFYQDMQASPEKNSVLLNFPYRIFESAKNDNFLSEQLNPYPDYFGDVFIARDNRIVYNTDNRGRILSQIMYDGEDNILWSIENTWSQDRIVSILKTEGDIAHLAEYEYDSKGNRILERNYKNGALERLVRTEDKTDIEELYLNGVVVLRAVWEDGRKISENAVR